MEVESTAGSSVYDMGLGWEPSLGGLASSWELVADLTFTGKSGELDRRDPRNGNRTNSNAGIPNPTIHYTYLTAPTYPTGRQ